MAVRDEPGGWGGCGLERSDVKKKKSEKNPTKKRSAARGIITGEWRRLHIHRRPGCRDKTRFMPSSETDPSHARADTAGRPPAPPARNKLGTGLLVFGVFLFHLSWSFFPRPCVHAFHMHTQWQRRKSSRDTGRGTARNSIFRTYYYYNNNFSRPERTFRTSRASIARRLPASFFPQSWRQVSAGLGPECTSRITESGDCLTKTRTDTLMSVFVIDRLNG